MATLKKGLDITGPLGNLSIYQARGLDNKIVRQKGGPTREQILHGPNFALTRLNNQEFTGCVLAGKHLRLTFVSLRNLSGGYNFSAPINGLMQLVQKQDTLNPKGTRSIALSKYPDILRGFPLNKTNLFDVIVRTTLEWSLDRATRTARVDIPALMRGINFVPQDDHALFRLEISLGMAPDFLYNHDQKKYQPPQWYGTNNGTGTLKTTTPWYASKQGCPPSTLELALDRIPQDESYTLILTLGIRFGALYGDSIVKEVKYAGAAKILGAAGA